MAMIVVGCGVKGSPLPPLEPTPLGRGIVELESTAPATPKPSQGLISPENVPAQSPNNSAPKKTTPNNKKSNQSKADGQSN